MQEEYAPVFQTESSTGFIWYMASAGAMSEYL